MILIPGEKEVEIRKPKISQNPVIYIHIENT
jgi:hypothetical protein